jgi:hypothetical protein
MKIPFAHNKPVIFIAIGLIVVSTAALSFVSYHYTVRRENAVETTLEQNTVRQVLHYVDLIEEKLLDNDRILSEKIVNVDDPANWPAMVDAIKKADLNVDQVYFLRPDGKKTLYPPYSYEIRNQWGRFHAILKEIDLNNLPLNQPHHLHKERPDNYFFMTYVLRETMDGSRILVCYQLNFDSIIALLDRHLRDLQDRF